MKKRKIGFNFNDVYLYEWGELYWYKDEINVGYSAIEELIKNQEKSLVEAFEKTQILKEEKLPNIPEDYRASYEQQFFEYTDKINYQLRIVQRYSACLMIFTFFEGNLEFLVNRINEEFNLKFEYGNRQLINKFWSFFRNVYELNVEEIEPYYTKIINQKIIRDKIAHNRGTLSEKEMKKFKKVDGLGLTKFNEIVIKPEYFEYLIASMKQFYKQLFYLIDMRYKELKGKN